MKVLLATKNKVKIEKWGNLIKELGYELVTLNDLDGNFEEPTEDGETVLENALIKVKYYFKKTNMPVLTTDSSLYMDGLKKEEQFGLFAGREVVKDENGNIMSERKLTDEENYNRFKSKLEELGGCVKGYFEEALVLYYGTDTYESKTFKMNRTFKLPGSDKKCENAPMRSFAYYEKIDKYRADMTDEEYKLCEGETFLEQQEFLKKNLYKIEHLMEYNYDILLDRVLCSNSSLRLDELKEKLKEIRNSCICIGTGGSYAPAVFASKVIKEVNSTPRHEIISIPQEPLDSLKDRISAFENMLAITYSNKNYGIDRALERARKDGLRTYVLTASDKQSQNDIILAYPNFYSKEYSFISISSTLSPMMFMLKYYLNASEREMDMFINRLYSSVSKMKFIDENSHSFNKIKCIEVMTSYDTDSAANIIRSTLVESGIGMPVIHNKYGYCHGPSTLSKACNNENILIYLISGEMTDLDNGLLNDCKPYYDQIIILDSKEKDKIIGDFELSMKALFLCKEIALSMNKSLSKVDYSTVARKYYKFNGGM